VGLIKGFFFLSGMPVRPSTTRERSRKYQRQTNAWLEQIAESSNPSFSVSPQLNLAESTPSIKTCPDCAESILFAARKCRFCGFRFDENQIQERALDVEMSVEKNDVAPIDEQIQDENHIPCGFCGLLIQNKAIFCKHCRQEFPRTRDKKR